MMMFCAVLVGATALVGAAGGIHASLAVAGARDQANAARKREAQISSEIHRFLAGPSSGGSFDRLDTALSSSQRASTTERPIWTLVRTEWVLFLIPSIITGLAVAIAGLVVSMVWKEVNPALAKDRNPRCGAWFCCLVVVSTASVIPWMIVVQALR